MKVAFVTEDGKNVSKHFGRASYYLIVEIENGKVSSRNLVAKGGCDHNHEPSNKENEQKLHMGQETKHKTMIRQADGCNTVVSGGMGMGAYQSLLINGVNIFITKIDSIDEALALLIDGKLDNNLEMLH
jgi:predicted Fe-Mo cluster-binding NifX family protein